MARADGSLTKLLARFARTHLLVLDDWGLAKLVDQERRDLLEIIEDRVGNRSTLIASQLPVESWYEVIGEATVADAILDRVVHNAHRINMKMEGESMRKKKARLTDDQEETNS